ncbi:unnamed protein product [Amoebophrya sp. A120]|nr:unnamed protein product [Amoebophrya sp. A120]|eukprot:GSA120T00021118001.1
MLLLLHVLELGNVESPNKRQSSARAAPDYSSSSTSPPTEYVVEVKTNAAPSPLSGHSNNGSATLYNFRPKILSVPTVAGTTPGEDVESTAVGAGKKSHGRPVQIPIVNDGKAKLSPEFGTTGSSCAASPSNYLSDIEECTKSDQQVVELTVFENKTREP